MPKVKTKTLFVEESTKSGRVITRSIGRIENHKFTPYPLMPGNREEISETNINAQSPASSLKIENHVEDFGIKVDELTNQDIKDKLSKKFPKVREEAFEVLVENDSPMTSTDHMKMSLSLLKHKDKTNNPALREVLFLAAYFHGEAVELINEM